MISGFIFYFLLFVNKNLSNNQTPCLPLTSQASGFSAVLWLLGQHDLWLSVPQKP